MYNGYTKEMIKWIKYWICIIKIKIELKKNIEVL